MNMGKAVSYQAQRGSRPIIVRLSSEQGYIFIECFILFTDLFIISMME